MWESNASNNERCIHFPIESLVEIRLGKNMSQDAKEDIKRIAKTEISKCKNNRMPLMRTAEILSV